MSMKSDPRSSTAIITARGIRYMGHYYSCQHAIKEGWFDNKKIHSPTRFKCMMQTADTIILQITPSLQLLAYRIIPVKDLSPTHIQMYYAAIERLKKIRAQRKKALHVQRSAAKTTKIHPGRKPD